VRTHWVSLAVANLWQHPIGLTPRANGLNAGVLANCESGCCTVASMMLRTKRLAHP
jgi:hypothetical protein